MSKFSVYLKELFDQRGEPIARVAKTLGIERTSIHKALKDERILSYTAVRQLAQYFQLTLPQVRELNQYYEMLLQGEDIYRIQEAICELLSELSQLHFSSYHHIEQEAAVLDLKSLPGLICGKPQVESTIQTILQWEAEASENAELILNLPEDCALTDSLVRLWQNGQKFTVRQIVAFLPNHNGDGTRIENLSLLKKLLPLSLVSQGNYFAYYYFEENTSPGRINPLAYYIVTPHVLITLDYSLSAAQIQTDPKMLQLYRRRFSQIQAECQPLNSYLSDPAHILQSYMQNTDEEGYYTLMAQPCLGHYYTRERIERQVRAGLPSRKLLVELADKRFSRLRGLEENYFTIFSEEGLRKLADDGIMVDLPTEFVEPFDIRSRRELFLELYRDIQEEKIQCCLADTEKLPIPPYLTFTCDPRFGLHIYAVQGFTGGAYACNIHIGESSIGRSFCDFIKSLPQSKFVYPKEKTLELLDELIRGLETAQRKEAGSHA